MPLVQEATNRGLVEGDIKKSRFKGYMKNPKEMN